MMNIFWLLCLMAQCGGVSCFSFNGNKTVEASKGENVDIKWTLNELTSGSLILKIYLKENNIDANEIIYTAGDYSKDRNFTISSPKLSLSQRTTATYTYDDTTTTGTVKFTITKLEINDSNNYILLDDLSKRKFTTTLSVQVEPERCGTPLKSSYTVNGTESLNIILGVCGKPQPVVKCSLGSDAVIELCATEIGQHNYSYTASIPTTNLEPCEPKNLVCIATGFGDSIKKTASVTANFFSSETQFIEGLDFVKQSNTDSIQVSWVKKVNTGSCVVYYELNYFNENDGTIATLTEKVNTESLDVNNDGKLVYTNEKFSNKEAVKVKVVTNVVGKVNGDEIVLETRTSSPVVFREDIVTTVPPKTTPAHADVFSCEEKNVILIVFALIIAISVSINAVFLILIKSGKLSLHVIHKEEVLHKEENENTWHARTPNHSINTNPQSNYMELQATTKPTYEALNYNQYEQKDLAYEVPPTYAS